MYSEMICAFAAKYDGPGKGLASRACNWYINSRYGFRVSITIEFFSVEGDPPCMFSMKLLSDFYFKSQ